MDVDLGGFLNQTSSYDYNDSYEYEVDPEPTQASQPSGWSLGAPLCKISGAVFNINFYCGIFLLVCISLVRCLSCLSSIQGKLAVSHGICLLVYLISILLTIPDWIFLMPVKDKNGEEKTVCVHNYSPSGFDQQLFSRLPHHTLGFLLPATTLIICCSSILLRLQSRSKSRQKQRAVMVIVPLVTVFLLCWMPYNITLIVDTYRNLNQEPHGDDFSGNSEGSLETALKVTFALGCVHACLRPLLYFGLCRNFRKRTLAMLRCATFEPEGSLWELGVDKEGLPGQSPEGEALKQITDKQHQV
ncbi:C-X-C chemokine receptor type 1-like isoform X2 [Toxotes jaculatrix]|uniref:C-X-C chemokine receptor type 1-like isoform X2 n=1 Tax=Toxotes jaculatrix TaxID=941984 RepID=UPI001B3A8A12|nr:C-X-C chemokine receptor type 1-like isoform X2 [Toxotes jaculatrix]XP_040900209.1 C-X-C chemokine receptor type 1-like isoform X2 [Toxotes jaculatrix]